MKAVLASPDTANPNTGANVEIDPSIKPKSEG
jgi:hypothetical protein